jgi:hypothetical protein
VCGEARHQCTVAVGDWNAPVSRQPFCNFTVRDRWEQLLGGGGGGAEGEVAVSVGTGAGVGQLIAAPDENTCCFPESKYRGWDDHAVTSIPGATVSATVLP